LQPGLRYLFRPVVISAIMAALEVSAPAQQISLQEIVTPSTVPAAMGYQFESTRAGNDEEALQQFTELPFLLHRQKRFGIAGFPAKV
jgi:hypothetical protein